MTLSTYTLQRPNQTPPSPPPAARLLVNVYDKVSGNKLVTFSQNVSAEGQNKWEELNIGLTANQAVDIEVVCENTSNTAVFFDEISVKVQSVPTVLVVQENHYYPFGLGMRGLDWTLNPNRENKYQYNGGVEKNTDFDLNWYETFHRSLDVQTGRFLQVDPLAEDGKQENLTPYHYSYNNPIRYNDPKGDCPPNVDCNNNLPVPSDPKPSLPERIVKGVGEFIGNALGYVTSSYKLEMKGSFGSQIGGNINTQFGEVGVELNLASVEMASMTVEKKANEILPKITHHYHDKKDEQGNPVVRFTHKIGLKFGGVGASISVSHDYHKQADGSSKQGQVKVKTTFKFLDHERETETIAKPNEEVKTVTRKSITQSNSFMLGVGYEIKASKILEEKNK